MRNTMVMDGKQNATEFNPNLPSVKEETHPSATNVVGFALEDEVVVPSFEKHKGFRPPPNPPRVNHGLPMRGYRSPPIAPGAAHATTATTRLNNNKADKTKKQKRRDHMASLSKHSLHIHCLELPTKQTREIMRQVSGLGMEDPVFGLASNHSIYRRAAKNMPFKDLYDDMGIEDIPADMRDMLSVCSDPTASIHGELPRLSMHRIAEESDQDLLHLSKCSGLGAFERFHQSYDSAYFSRAAERFQRSYNSGSYSKASSRLSSSNKKNDLLQQHSSKLLSSPRKTERHQFVPPKSISEFQEFHQQQPIQEIPVDFSFSNLSNYRTSSNNNKNHHGKATSNEKRRVEDSPNKKERPSDRRWRNSSLAALNKPDNRNRKKSVNSKKPIVERDNSSNAAKHHRSFDDFNWDWDDDKEDEEEEEELQLEDLFTTMNKMKEQTKHFGKYAMPSKLSASDGNLRYFPTNEIRVKKPDNNKQVKTQKQKQPERKKSSGGMEGLELHVKREEFSRTVSGLTLDAALVSQPSVHGGGIPETVEAPTVPAPANAYQELMAVLQLEKSEHDEEIEPAKDDGHRKLDSSEKEFKQTTKDISDDADPDTTKKKANRSFTISELRNMNDDVASEESIDIVKPETNRLSTQNRRLADSMSRINRWGHESSPASRTNNRSSRQGRTTAADVPLSPQEKRSSKGTQESFTNLRQDSIENARERRKSASARRCRTIAIDEVNANNKPSSVRRSRTVELDESAVNSKSSKNEFITRHYSHEEAKAEERKAHVRRVRSHEESVSKKDNMEVDAKEEHDDQLSRYTGSKFKSETPPRNARKSPAESFSHDSSALMPDKFQVIEVNFQQHHEQQRKNHKGAKKSSRNPTKKSNSNPNPDFHASMGVFSYDGKDDLGTQTANKSCSDLDFIGEI